MALTAAIDLTVNKPDFKSMKSEIKELTLAAQQAVMTFGEFSPEAVKAEKALAGAKDRMEDFNDRVQAVNPDKFSQINTVVQGVASGFAAAQGAMALFGADTDSLQKQMVKLQGAMALAQGLEGLGKIQQQFGAIFKDVISGAKKAFAAIKAGIGSTGIGLIVIALGAIVGYWDDIKEAVSGVSDEQKELLKQTQKTAEANQKSYDAISKSENILKQQGKTEEEILNLKINASKVSVKNLEIQLTTQQNIRQSQIDTAKRNRDILQGIIRFINAPLITILNAVDSVGKVIGQDFGLEEKFSKGVSEMLFDPEEVKEQADKSIEETKEALKKLQNDVAGFEISINDIHKKVVDEKKKLDEDAQAKELADLKTHQESLLAVIDQAYSVKRKRVVDDAEFDKKLGGEQVVLQEGQYQKEYSDREKLAGFIKTQHSELINSTIGYFNTIGELADAFASKDEASQKRAFEIGKAMRYASTVLSTIEGTQNAFTTATDSPITTLFPAYPFIQAAAAALFGIAQLKKIKNTQFKSGQVPSPTQMGGGGMPQMSAPSVSSNLPEVSGFNQRVFVTEGDISRTQARVQNIKKVSVVK